MSGIFGVFRRDGAPVHGTLASMRSAMPEWGRDGFGEWSDGCAALGQARTSSTPECRFERLPLHDSAAGFVFTAAGRLDNREALISELGLREPASAAQGLGDGEVMMAAYRRWGERAPVHLLGDWSLAAWHPDRRRLFLARDQFGQTALYYHCDANGVAFCSSQRALLALRLTPLELDELYLAQYLISWPRYHGERTAASGLRRLPPAHTLAVTPERAQVACYWRLEDQLEPVRLPTRSDYAVALREIFDEAVRTRLRSDGQVGLMLSGGLDSGAVATTAAALVRRTGQRMTAFTSVPIGSARDDDRMFGDELPFVRATAAAAGNVDVVPVPASRLSPIEGIRRALDLFGAPQHAASNMFWMLALHEQAQASGCRVLLNGGVGNSSISWPGDPLSQPLTYQLRSMGLDRWLRRRIKRALPVGVRVSVAKRRLDPEWWRFTAIDQRFARRLELGERRLEDPETFPRTPLEQRLGMLKPGRSRLGTVTAELGARFGVDVRDPTADIRVLAFTLSVPDAVFINAHDGSRRWLVREAMRNRLPDQVRLNRRQGLQAADLVTRLRSCAREVEDALDELHDGPATAYLDVARMRASWRAIQREETVDTHRMAVSILTRGIMGGLHVNAVVRGDMFGLAATG
jgi:asparagine synthase (glutamine-hydrolysing)